MKNLIRKSSPHFKTFENSELRVEIQLHGIKSVRITRRAKLEQEKKTLEKRIIERVVA